MDKKDVNVTIRRVYYVNKPHEIILEIERRKTEENIVTIKFPLADYAMLISGMAYLPAEIVKT